MSLPVYTAPIYPKLLQFAFVMLELALKPCVVDLLDSILMSSVAPISLLRYSPMPPGFWLSVDRSPPRAVNAPPIDMKRAVPRRPCCESWNASVAVCAPASSGREAAIAAVIRLFFILFLLKRSRCWDLCVLNQDMTLEVWP